MIPGFVMTLTVVIGGCLVRVNADEVLCHSRMPVAAGPMKHCVALSILFLYVVLLVLWLLLQA